MTDSEPGRLARWLSRHGILATPQAAAELAELDAALDRIEAEEARRPRSLGPTLQEAPGRPETAEPGRSGHGHRPQGDQGTATPPRSDPGPRPADARPWPRRPGP